MAISKPTATGPLASIFEISNKWTRTLKIWEMKVPCSSEAVKFFHCTFMAWKLSMFKDT